MEERGKLYNKTLELLRNRKVSLSIPTIAVGTGLDVCWIRHFQRGKFDSASTNVEKLYEYLSGKKLEV